MSFNLNTQTDEKPWFKQFWPWFLIILPLTVIIACFITIYLAVVNPVNFVKKDYYKEGLTINKNLSAKTNAAELNISADLTLNYSSALIQIALQHKQNLVVPSKLIISFTHPTNTQKDIRLFATQKQHQSTQTEYLIAINADQLDILSNQQRWYIEIEPHYQTPLTSESNATDNTGDDLEIWQLSGELNKPYTNQQAIHQKFTAGDEQ